MIFLLCELFRGFEDATFLASSIYKKDRPNIEKLRPEQIKQYSEDLKSDHLKSGNIWNSDFLKVGFQMVGP